MRSKVTVVLLFLNVVLFAYIYFYDNPTLHDARTKAAGHNTLPPAIASMDSFTRTTRTGEVVKIAKKPNSESWWIEKPYEWPASTEAVTHIYNELQFLRDETSFAVADLAKSGQSLADYGLADPAVTFEFTAAGKSYKFLIGDDTKVGNRLYMLSTDGTRVHVVGRSLMDSVGLPLAELRNDAIFTIPVFEVRSLNIQTTAPSNLKVRVRRDAGGRWGFESPIQARAAKTAVELTINTLNALAAKTFLDPHDADLERTGLNSPMMRVTLEGNARRETLLIGSPAPATGDYYAKIEDKAVVFTTTVHPKLLEVLRASQETLRDAHVVDFEPATVTALTLTAPGQPDLALQKLEAPAPSAAAAPVVTAKSSASKDAPAPDAAAKPPAPVEAWQVVTRLPGQAPVTVPGDPAVITGLLKKIQLLAARKFLSDAPAAADLERYGFNRPEREVTLNLSNGGGLNGTEPSTLVLQIGLSPDEPGKAFARLTNPSFVYEILPDILTDAPVQARHYRQRQLRDLPEGAVITSLTLVDTATNTTIYTQKLKEGDKNWDAALAAEPEAARPVLAGLLAQLRKLRAQDFVADTFQPDHAETAQGARPWRYRLDYAIAFNGGDTAQATPSSLLLTERLGGTAQVAGTADFGGVVFNLTQEMIDPLFTLIYGNKHDPGPPASAPADAKPTTLPDAKAVVAPPAETKPSSAPPATTPPAAPAPTKP